MQAVFCNLVGAEQTFNETLSLIEDLKGSDQAPNLAGIYTDFSFYYFTKNEFHEVSKYLGLAFILLLLF